MAIIKSLTELEKFIPSKTKWLLGENNRYCSLEDEENKKLYAFFINPSSRKVKNAYRVDLVVYKGMASAFLIIVEHNKNVSSKCPSIRRNVTQMTLTTYNEWGFEEDILGMKTKTNSPQNEYIVYFGTGIEDVSEITAMYNGGNIKPSPTTSITERAKISERPASFEKRKVTIVTETVYV